MKTMYSVRDALGKELWWTTGRVTALRLVRDFNMAGVGAKMYIRAGGSQPYAARASAYQNTLSNTTAGLVAHQLPVVLWKCSAVQTEVP